MSTTMSRISFMLHYFFTIFLTAYASYVAGFTETRAAEYLVKIDGIPIYRDSANRVLRGFKGKGEGMRAYDNLNNRETFLSVTKENMDITIVGKNELMEAVAKLYKSYLGEDKMDSSDVEVIYEDGNRKCMRSIGNNVDMQMCVSKIGGMVVDIAFARAN